MTFSRTSSFSAGFLILCILTKTSHALDCYACNVSTSTVYEDACTGIESLNKCVGSSVCLSAAYNVNSGIVETYTIMRTCFPNMAGQECANFIKGQKDLLPQSGSISLDYCYTCARDNCNKNTTPYGKVSRGVSNNVLPMTIFSILILNIFRLF